MINRWSSIATHLPKRTDNEIKNYWNTHLKKKLIRMGIDPVTHKPKDNIALNICESKYIANISHMAQWESARLQAEARLVRESKLVSISHPTHATTAPPPTLPCLDILKVWEWTNPAAKQINSSMLLNGGGPDNMFTAVGLHNENSYINTTLDNSVGNLNVPEGIIQNSMELHSYADDSLGFSSFIDGFIDLPTTGNINNAPGSCCGALEGNAINRWNS